MDNVREMKKRLDLIVEKDQQLMEDESSHNTLPSDGDGEENTTTCTTSTISTTVDVEITSPPVIVRASSHISQKNKTKSPITVSVEGKYLSTSASDPKGYRLTSQQRLSSAAREVKEKRKRNIAFNEACILLHNERKKHKGSTTSKALSANQVAVQVGKKYNVSLSKRSLNRKLLSGESFHLGHGGPKGFFATDIEYTCLKAAFSTAVSLHQSTKNSEAKAGEWKTALQHFLGNEAQGKTSGLNLYMRLTRDCSTLLNIDSEYFVELRRQQWTNDFNLNHWFDNWKKFCLVYGFATPDEMFDEEGTLISEITFTEEQKRRIINLDETAVTMEGSDGGKGGRPPSVLSTKGVARTGTGSHKSDSSLTAIFAHNAAGEVAGPHLHFPSEATVENMRADLSWILGMPRGFGQFGFDSYRDDIPMTFGTNEKGGMDADAFRDYLQKNILPLYPDAADVPSKRVIIKCDGGPGRLDWATLVDLRLKGFYLYPTVPNATHVMQELDISYGLFKTMQRKNAQVLMDERVNAGKPGRLSKNDLGVMINGRMCGTDDDDLPSPFHTAFSKENNLSAWNKVGACPLNRNAIKHPSVGKIVVSSENDDNVPSKLPIESPLFQLYVETVTKEGNLLELERINAQCVDNLLSVGWKAEVLRRKAPRKTNLQKAMELAKTKSSEQIIIDLAGSSRSHSNLFVKTGGGALNSNEALQAGALVLKRTKRVKERKEFKSKVAAFKRQQLGQDILTLKKEDEKHTVQELTNLVKWKMNGEGHSKIKGRTAMLKKWKEVKDTDNVPIVIDPGVMSAEEEDVAIPTIDEALAELREGSRQETMIQSLAKLDNDEIQLMVKKVEELKKAAPPKTELVRTMRDVSVELDGVKQVEL